MKRVKKEPGGKLQEDAQLQLPPGYFQAIDNLWKES